MQDRGTCTQTPSTQAASATTTTELGSVPLLRDGAGAETESPAVALGVTGRLALGLIRTMLTNRPSDLRSLRQPRLAPVVHKLQSRITVVLSCASLCVPIAVWLFVRSCQFYLDPDEPICENSLQDWLLGFICLQLVWPVCMPAMTAVLLVWSLVAMLLFLESPDCPGLKAFVVEAVALEAVMATLFIIAGVTAFTCRPLIHRLDKILGCKGTDPDVLSLIPTMDFQDAAADQECAICLNSQDGELQWRQLSCGHCFHEPCLLEWLAKARQCPVCRLDLHLAYGHEGRDGQSVASTAAVIPAARPTQRRRGCSCSPLSATESSEMAVTPEGHV